MKTFFEQTQEIVKSNATVASKKRALIKLGLREVDVNNLLYTYTREEREQARAKRVAEAIINSLTFGVEIECYNAASNIIRERATANNLNIEYERYNHRDGHNYFKFTTDASIQGAMPIECVSPVLKGKSGFADLKKCCKTLNEAGVKVNRSTGLHVHVGGIQTHTQYVNVFRNYQMLERVIDTFMAESRRANNSNWCRTLSDHNFDGCTCAQDVREVLGCDRYHRVNAESWVRHQTIEFRQHAGSTNFEKIQMWVTFCIKLVVWSAENVLTETINTIQDIPFLSDKEKAYFQKRANEFAGVAA